jgi:hypothetical protein
MDRDSLMNIRKEGAGKEKRLQMRKLKEITVLHIAESTSHPQRNKRSYFLTYS